MMQEKLLIFILFLKGDELSMEKDNRNMNAIEMFFYYLDLERDKLISIIDSCLNKVGIAIDECIAYAFAEEYDVYEEGYFGKEGLKIVIQEPVVDQEKEEIYSLKTFFCFINNYYKENLAYYNEKDRKIIEYKLKEIKKSLFN